MSKFVLFLEKITSVLSKIDLLNNTYPGDKNKVLELIQSEVEESFQLVPRDSPIMAWFDKLEHSKDAEDDSLLQEYDTYDQETKKAVKKMMEFVYKLGELEGANDLAHRKHWYDKIMSHDKEA